MVAKESRAEATFALFVRAAKLPGHERNYRFWAGRRFEFDFAWPIQRVAVEIQGTIRSGQGDHQTQEGMMRDFIKHNQAILDGWLLLLVTQQQVHNGYALEVVRAALEQRKERV